MAGAVGRAGKGQADAYQQLESILLRQMLQSSGAFKAEGTSPGAQLRTDMFVETLADAVAKAGGLGIARMLQQQMGGGAPSAPAADGGARPAGFLSAPPKLDPLRSSVSLERARQTPGGGLAPWGISASASGSISGAADGLEDPNSDAPLPEDPAAGSIDDYQPRQRPSALRTISPGRALNRYRERAEEFTGGTLSSASGGEEP